MSFKIRASLLLCTSKLNVPTSHFFFANNNSKVCFAAGSKISRNGTNVMCEYLSTETFYIKMIISLIIMNKLILHHRNLACIGKKIVSPTQKHHTNFINDIIQYTPSRVIINLTSQISQINSILHHRILWLSTSIKENSKIIKSIFLIWSCQ